MNFEYKRVVRGDTNQGLGFEEYFKKMKGMNFNMSYNDYNKQ